MAQLDRIGYLEESDYEAPYDESPVEMPTGWEGGIVEHTGGGIFCRIWRREIEQEDGTFLYQVIYDVTNETTVCLDIWKYNEEKEYFDRTGQEILAKAPEQTDEAQAKVAKTLMEMLELHKAIGISNEALFGLLTERFEYRVEEKAERSLEESTQ